MEMTHFTMLDSPKRMHPKFKQTNLEQILHKHSQMEHHYV